MKVLFFVCLLAVFFTGWLAACFIYQASAADYPSPIDMAQESVSGPLELSK